MTNSNTWDGYRVSYKAWHSMISRCFNPEHPAYSNYGGRGITVCKRWIKYENFLIDMGPCPDPDLSLDRYPDNDGDYKKSNCRWATRTQQAENRRPLSDEHRQSLSKASIKMWKNRSEAERREIGRKISEAEKDRPLAPEHVKALKKAYEGSKGAKRRKLMSEKMKNRTFSEETRRKMSEAAKRRFEKTGWNPNPNAR